MSLNVKLVQEYRALSYKDKCSSLGEKRDLGSLSGFNHRYYASTGFSQAGVTLSAIWHEPQGSSSSLTTQLRLYCSLLCKTSMTPFFSVHREKNPGY